MSTVNYTNRITYPQVWQSAAERSLPTWLWATTFVLLAALWFIDHDFSVIGRWDQAIGQTVADAAKIRNAEWESGLMIRRVGFAVAAVWGVLLIFWAPRRQVSKWQGPLALLVGAYLALCFGSVLWSDQPLTTAKKLVIYACMVVAAVGIGPAIRPRQLCLIATLVTTTLALIGWSAELATGAFRPWSSEYRLSGTLHPNTMGAYASVACIGAFCLWRFGRRAPWWGAIAFLMLALTALTKSRMALFALLAALVIVSLGRMSRAGLATAGAYVLTAAAVVLLLLGVANRNVQGEAAGIVLLNRQDEVRSLTGRTPLWRELATHVAARPLLGHGFAGFWTTNRHVEVAKQIEWPAFHAHSAYLGAALELGVLGSGLWAAIVLFATYTAFTRFRGTTDPGYGFLLGVGAFVLTFSGTETMFFMMEGLVLIFLPGIALLALGDWEEESP